MVLIPDTLTIISLPLVSHRKVDVTCAFRKTPTPQHSRYHRGKDLHFTFTLINTKRRRERRFFPTLPGNEKP